MSAPLVVVVHGRPITQGSKTKGRYGNIRDTNAETLKPWRDNVRSTARDLIGGDGHPGFGLAAVQVYIDFYFDRPTTHYRTGRNAHLLRDNAPLRPANKTSGDIDKLQRSCLDALTDAAVWRDDAQVVGVRADKWFVGGALGLDHPGAVIRVHATDAVGLGAQVDVPDDLADDDPWSAP